jgi:predicted DNA-binding transcriptional regulator AlpA
MRVKNAPVAPVAPILPADGMALVPLGLLFAIVGLKKSALFARIRAGRFPAPLRLSGRCSRFRVSDVREYLRDPLGWSQDKAADRQGADGMA